MPIAALRSVAEHLDEVIRHVNAKRVAIEIGRTDKAFHFKHFKGYRVEKIGRGRIKKIAEREVLQGDGHELFANLLIIHWNEAHAKLYEEMVTHVKTINEDVEAIERIEPDAAHAIIDDLLGRHELVDVLLCVRLNGVRFDEEVIASRLVRGEPAPEAGQGEGAQAEGDADASEEPTPSAGEG